MPRWQTGAKAQRTGAPPYLTTALIGWNALHTILALGVWQPLNPNASVEYQSTFSC